MKKLFPLVLLALIGACGKRDIDASGSLSETDREFLQTRSARRCMSRVTKDFAPFVKASNASMDPMIRGNSWKVVYKKGTSDIDFSTIQFWGELKDSFFFYLNTVSGSETRKEFLKIDKKSNKALIDDLIAKVCAKQKTLVVSGSAGGATAKLDSALEPDGSENKKQVFSTYKFLAGFPAYFGTRTLNKVEKYTKSDGTANTEKPDVIHDYTIVVDDNPPTLPQEWNEVANPYFCVPAKSFVDKPICTQSPTKGPTGWSKPAENLEGRETVEDVTPETQAPETQVPQQQPTSRVPDTTTRPRIVPQD
ncbi:MAG TPA: hypothetical protein VNJ01_17430 [Bacteriovoracaceae bacterium]|nr:hypothetical protein [Bacteriovoracaceae bacterium]